MLIFDTGNRAEIKITCKTHGEIELAVKANHSFAVSYAICPLCIHDVEDTTELTPANTTITEGEIKFQ